MGTLRTKDNNKAVNTATDLEAGTDIDGKFANSLELVSKLGETESVRECFSRNLFRFASAQNLEGVEKAFVNTWNALPADAHGNLIEALARMRRAPCSVERKMRPVSSVAVAYRRSFLRTVGVGAASLPLLKLLRAVRGLRPKPRAACRFGSSVSTFRMGPRSSYGAPRRAGPTSTSRTRTAVCSRSTMRGNIGASFKKKIVVIDGLDNLSDANGHDTAATILTGSRLADAGGVTKSPVTLHRPIPGGRKGAR